MKVSEIFLISLTVAGLSCQHSQSQKPDLPSSFAYDSCFILKHDSSTMVLTKENARVIVSLKYQAKVFTSSEWVTNKPPFSVNAVNAYNDGPLSDGTQMGPFYALESVSPAAFLKPGKSLIHDHAVFHFTGDERGLNTIAERCGAFHWNRLKASSPENLCYIGNRKNVNKSVCSQRP